MDSKESMKIVQLYARNPYKTYIKIENSLLSNNLIVNQILIEKKKLLCLKNRCKTNDIDSIRKGWANFNDKNTRFLQSDCARMKHLRNNTWNQIQDAINLAERSSI